MGLDLIGIAGLADHAAITVGCLVRADGGHGRPRQRVFAGAILAQNREAAFIVAGIDPLQLHGRARRRLEVGGSERHHGDVGVHPRAARIGCADDRRRIYRVTRMMRFVTQRILWHLPNDPAHRARR